MSDHDDHDPVRDFFARERDQVTPLPTSEDHWDSLLAAHRGARRGRGLTLVAASVAALLAAGGIVWATNRPGSTRTLPGTTTSSAPSTAATSAPSPTTAPTGTATATGSASTGTGTPGAITGFAVQSLSYAAKDTVYALGRVACPERGECPALARTTNGGVHWELVHTFTDHDVRAAGDQSPGTAGTLRDARFTGDTGWVFGTDLLRTTDGGRTWTKVTAGQPGRSVLALETDGRTVDAVTAGACGAEGCDGPLRLLEGPVDGPFDATADIPGVPSGATVTSAGLDLLRHGAGEGRPAGSTAVVSWATATRSGVTHVAEGGPDSPSLPGCSADRDAGRLLQPSDGGGVFGWCVAGAQMSHTGIALSRRDPTTGRLVPVGSGFEVVGQRPVLAAADARHLVVVTTWDPSTPGQVEVSSDGGVSWHEPASPPADQPNGWSWVGAPGGSLYYAVPAGDSPSFWLSADRGESWTEVTVRG